MSEKPIIKLIEICKSFENSKAEILKNINLEIFKGDFSAITGPSGSGKSTLLHIISCLENPSSGKIIIDSVDASSLNEKALTIFRQKYIGLVFQFHFLLPEFNALENIMIPQLFAGKSQKEAKNKAEHLLDKVNILDKKSHKPSQMSGGEQQRVAIARALSNDPVILLADEPTGNLDSKNSKNIYSLLRELNETLEQTILVITHEHNFASKADKIIEIEDGRIKV
ncbi:MAG: ABC transporter ATP-binding protein [Candidatus Sericytochromatia bacterium]